MRFPFSKKWTVFATLFLIPVVVTVVADKLVHIDILGRSANVLSAVFAGLSLNLSLPLWFVLLIAFVVPAAILHSPFLLTQGRNRFIHVAKSIWTRLPFPNLLRSDSNWEDVSYLPEHVRLKLLGYQNSGGLIAYRRAICGAEYEPGTFRISEVEEGTTFLKSKLSYDAWVTQALAAELMTLRNRYSCVLGKHGDTDLSKRAKSVLDARTDMGHPLKHDIWYQEYSDVLRRVLLFCAGSDPDVELELFPNLTFQRKIFILNVIVWLENHENPSLRQWLNLSIAAGLLGVNEKSPHTATSEINAVHTIPLDSPNEIRSISISRVGQQVYKLAQSRERIDASEWLFQYLNLSHGINVNIVSFPDDYIETIFLLKFYEELLLAYDNVSIDCVPRMIRCGNDARFADFPDLLCHFSFLKACSRFRVHDKGPKLGTVNLTKLHPSILNLVEDCDFVDARGARNYEMMQGINKKIFFGFMVCREFSEATTGLCAEETPLIYIKQSSGERSFSGFRKRTKKRRYFCATTARERRRKWEGGHLASYSSWSDDEKARYKVNQEFYSKGALDFHKKYGDLLETEVKTFLSEIAGRVLVLGCGSGKEVGYLFQGGRDVVGMDFSVEAIQLARNRYPHLWDRFFVEDLYNTKDFSEGSFNGVVANAAFVHLLRRGDLGDLLEQVHARLCPGGSFFLRLLDKEGTKEEYDTHLFNSRRWFVYYEEDEILKLTDKIGFNILRNDRFAHMQYNKVFWLSFLLQKA